MTAYSLVKQIIRNDPKISDSELIQQVYGSILESQGKSLEELSALGVIKLVSNKKLPAFESVPRLKRMVLQEQVIGQPKKQKLKLF